MDYQAALMAPTEVLARQHYEGFQKLMEEQNLSFPTVLLTGSDTAREKRLAYAKIASGEALVIIGTHALNPGKGGVCKSCTGDHR